VSVNFEQGLLATGHERSFAFGVTGAAIINVALNLLLIPSLGPEGSALSTIAAQLVVLVFGAFRVASVLGMPTILWSRVSRAAVAALIMVLLLETVLSAWPVLVQVIAGAALYAVLAMVTGAIRLSDYRQRGPTDPASSNAV
jgi:stage V sporulation protein B